MSPAGAAAGAYDRTIRSREDPARPRRLQPHHWSLLCGAILVAAIAIASQMSHAASAPPFEYTAGDLGLTRIATGGITNMGALERGVVSLATRIAQVDQLPGPATDAYCNRSGQGAQGVPEAVCTVDYSIVYYRDFMSNTVQLTALPGDAGWQLASGYVPPVP